MLSPNPIDFPAWGETNPRFVVTSLKRREAEAQHLYKRIYCARGEAENPIKGVPA
jgi:hypothetical protein